MATSASAPATIRPATPADLADLQRLNAELFKFEDGLDVHDHSRNLDWPYTGVAVEYFRNVAPLRKATPRSSRKSMAAPLAT